MGPGRAKNVNIKYINICIITNMYKGNSLKMFLGLGLVPPKIFLMTCLYIYIILIYILIYFSNAAESRAPRGNGALIQISCTAGKNV